MPPTPFPLRRAVRIGLAAALLAAGTCAHAAGLGEARGAVLLGRPLDVRLPVLQDHGEALPTDCVQATVSYGESQVPERLVTATVEGSTGAQSVRVRATPAINEPVVSLQVQVGCQARLTRRVVLLADPVLGEETLPRATPPAAATAPTAQAPAAPRAAPAPARATAAQPAPTSAPKPRASAKPSARMPAAASAPRSRLQVEPLDLTMLGEPALRLSDSLAPRDEVSSASRAQWAATWRALNAQAEDFAQLQQRIAQLQREQQAAAVQQREQQQGFEKRLAQLESQRYANPLVAALAVATLAALALAAALAWRLRRKTRERWWEGAEDDDDDTQPARATTMPAMVENAQAEPPADVAAEPAEASSPAPAPEPPAPAPPRHDYDFSPRSAIMSLEAEELLHVKESVDFFAALGQYDRAVDALRQHVEKHPESSALGWLELLHLLIALGRRDEFTRARSEMMRLFNIEVPSFDRWDSNQRRLEQYPGVMERITSLWPSPDVLQVIEHAIFREDIAHQETFSVAAFDDLVLLHEVCRELVEAQASGAGGFSFEVDWRPSAWNKLQGHRPPPRAQVLDEPEADAELDLDLSQHGDLAPEPAQAHAPDAMDLDLDIDVSAFGAPDHWRDPDPR